MHDKLTIYDENYPSRRLLDVIGDKWKPIVLIILGKGMRRYGELQRCLPDVSKKMLTQTLRQMERDGLISRTVYPVVPPKVEYRLTELGSTLGEAFCGVWIWADRNLAKVEAARRAFDKRASER